MKRKQRRQTPAEPTTAAPIQFSEQLRYSIPVACVLLGYGKTTLYARAKAGHIKILRDGGRAFIAGAEIARLSRG